MPLPPLPALCAELVRQPSMSSENAPFDAGARFRFYAAGSSTAADAPPADLNDLRGIELYLPGVNERAPAGDAAEMAPLRTAVFFKN